MKIAIIGGGFSATSMLTELAAKQIPDLSIYVIDKGGVTSHGPAYDTPFSWHLLNVRARRMGVLHEEPDGFYRWLQEKGKMVDPEAFLSRKLYGEYLFSLKEKAKEKLSVEFIQDKVTDIEKRPTGLTVTMDDHPSIIVDKVVLATGVPPIRELPYTGAHYIPNLWDVDEKTLTDQIARLNKDSTICIIGTGLTMVDMVTTLFRLNYPGKIIALSRNGSLPAVHALQETEFKGSVDDIVQEKGLLNKFRKFREKLKHYDWRPLVDALRPYTVDLWKGLSLKEKKSFLKHLNLLWNKHRHRMAPESARIIETLKKQNRLEILSGTTESMNKNADFVFNCTGPDFTLRKREDSLIQNLLKRGLIQPDDLGLGVKVNDKLQAGEDIFVMGSLLYGERFETTSVPDLRHHSKIIAEELLLGLGRIS